MGEIVNPYIAGAPVTEQRMFFGREDVFQWIQNSLAGQYADHILVIHGQRRVGKTSVLKQLGNRLPERYLPLFFDLQGRTHTTLDRFLWWLAREIVRVLKQERGIEVPLPEKEDFAKDIEHFESRFLPELQPVLGGATLLLTFDEFDNLEESEVKEELARPLVDYLRRLMGRDGVNFIFSIGSSGRKLENMQAEYTEFFKTALYKKISFLNEEQARNLVTRPVENLIEYDEQAVTRIFQVAGGHPYFTQLTCHELFARCQRTEQRRIAGSDVEAILDDVVERGTVNLKFVWDEASDIEKWCLASLAQLDKADNRALMDFMRKQRARFNDSDLTSGLLRLREKDILTPDNRFVIHLLRLWLQKNRPLEQVREELTEVNPIANRYIEIGLEFRDAGIYEKAIESFQEALAVAKDNIQAQVNIALTYMDQKIFDRAVLEFEKALTLDDEDVSARAGLCEAQLALGDAAMLKNRPKDAVLSYQRVLSINAEHVEARGRMAEIERHRAEKALADGRDEEALSAFAEALKYTPEDPSLVARVEEVRAEKKARVLAAQVARSEKEAALRNWDKAIAALNEALQIAPEDEVILKKIGEVKEKQLQDRLNAILAKADQAERAIKWDAAIAALNEYLGLKEDAHIQKRLADLIEAKHAAWMKAILARVEGSVANQKWDEAFSALNEILTLEPGNLEIQKKMDEVRDAQRLAKLDTALKQAEQARQAGKWDEAIDALNHAITLSPQDDMLRASLKQAMDAKRAARLQAALRLAETAAQSEKWDAAFDSLNEILMIEPDNEEFKNKLKELQARRRMAKLNSLRAQAQGLTRAERFEEALSAWNAYLAMNPDDGDRGRVEIDSVKKLQALAKSYADAQAAYGKRHYDKAIALFKEVVEKDYDYKNASELLAEAVELRRTARKWWQNKWLRGAIGSVVLLAATWGVFRYGTPLMSTLFAPTSAPLTTDAPVTSTPVDATQAAVTETPEVAPVELPYRWARLNSGQFLPRDTVTAIVIDPTDPGVIYVGAENAGVFKSIDGGLSWQPSHAGLGRAWVYSLVMDPVNPQTLYAGTLLGGVYRTADGGSNWMPITDDLVIGWEWISIAAIDPSDNQHLYYTQASNIFESVNGGDSWQEIHNMETCPDNIVGLVVSPGNGSILFSSQETTEHKCDPGIYRSEDGGRSWTFISDALPASIRNTSSIWWNLALDQLAGEVLFAYSNEGLYRSKDRGVTWERLSNRVCDAFTLDPQNGSFAFCTEEERVYQTLDGGESWQETVRLGTNQRFHTIAISPHASAAVFLGGSGLWLSSDTGKSFEVRNSGLAVVRFELFTDPIDPSALVAQTTRGGFVACDFYRSSDGGRAWEASQYQSCHMGFSSPPSTWPVGDHSESLFAHPTIPDKIYAVYSRPENPPHLYISDDNGVSWHAAVGINSIADGRLFFDHDQGQRVYAIGDTDAYLSDDAGETWQECTRTDKWWSARTSSRMVVDTRDSDHLILATRGDGILISTDGCQSWQESSTGLASLFVNTLAMDLNSPDTIYAGTDGGAYISFDFGQTWNQINDGLLGATVVYSIVVDKDSNVYAATPYGIFKLEGK